MVSSWSRPLVSQSERNDANLSASDQSPKGGDPVAGLVYKSTVRPHGGRMRPPLTWLTLGKTVGTLSRGMVRLFLAGEGLAGNAIHIGNERDQIGDNLELLA
jgi:hypothetical protein